MEPTLPTPDWQDEARGVYLYCGDCLEILPRLPDGCVDCVITDPPYGIRYSPGDGGSGWTKGVKTFSGNNLVTGDNQDFDPRPFLGFDNLVLWGANHYADKLSPKSSWLVWDKRQDGLSNDFADCEMAWWSKGGPARMFRHLWCGAFRASERGNTRVHPTQKPIVLMEWCIKLCTTESDTILDPFMGSGTTGVAAVRMGRKFIGIEIERKYFDIAVKRIELELSQERMDLKPRPKEKQTQLL